MQQDGGPRRTPDHGVEGVDHRLGVCPVQGVDLGGEPAADALHSSTQFNGEPRRNSYIIDKAVAKTADLMRLYDVTLKKGQDALRDIEEMSFPNEQAKYIAIGGVYEQMARAYEQLHQYADAIAYERAAIEVGDRTGQEYLICHAYDQLRDYDDAIDACSKAVDRSLNIVPVHYWRGIAYRDKGDSDRALQDFSIVADSQDDLRISAAINMSMIYLGRGDHKDALSILNRYGYLYDPDLSTDQEIAAAYNDRCYAYMQLGNLKEALDDCTASLKYGTIADAFLKQQELIRRLNAHKETP